MRSRLSLVLTLVAWLLATGSHWDVVQTFAWGRMFADYSRTMTVAQALTKTFAPQAMCSLCHVVATAKQQADNPAVPAKDLGKIVLVCAPRAFAFTSPAPSCLGQVSAPLAPSSVARSAPPLPPPRALA